MWPNPEDNEAEELPINDEELDLVLEEKPKRRTRRTKEEKESEEYVSKDEMWNELFNYYVSLGDAYDWETQKVVKKDQFPPISARLTTIIYDIATKMGYRANFQGYSWLDEMVGDATLKMVKAVRDCSFKCYTVAQVVSRDCTKHDDNSVCTEEYVTYIDKKGQLQKKMTEDTDEFFEQHGIKFIKFKANPFGYFSRITSHSYLNRIKKEKVLEETKRSFQTETWEKLYSNENFRNVRRPKYIDPDESDSIFDAE